MGGEALVRVVGPSAIRLAMMARIIIIVKLTIMWMLTLTVTMRRTTLKSSDDERGSIGDSASNLSETDAHLGPGGTREVCAVGAAPGNEAQGRRPSVRGDKNPETELAVESAETFLGIPQELTEIHRL